MELIFLANATGLNTFFIALSKRVLTPGGLASLVILNWRCLDVTV